MADDRKTFEIIVALVLIVASFMYIYDALTRKMLFDVLIAVLLFGGSIVYLFSNVWGK